PDSHSTVTPPDEETQAIADHLIAFFEREVTAGRLPNNLGPLQAGIGNIANAVLCGLINSPFTDLGLHSEVHHDCNFKLTVARQMKFAPDCSITLSGRCN